MNECTIPNGCNILRVIKDYHPVFRVRINEYPQIEEFAKTPEEAIELAYQKIHELQSNNQ